MIAAIVPYAACSERVTVRAAEEGDRSSFRDLVRGYLEDTATGDILPCEENIEVYSALFDRYLRDGGGAVLVAAKPYGRPLAFTMAGEIPHGFRTRHGRAAMGWGTYVTPPQRRRGIARQLREALDVRLREMGFDTVIGGFHPGNVAAEASLKGTGFEVYQVLGAKSLKEGE